MKKIAKLFAVTAMALFVCVSASAQDLAQATELYNAAATALNEGNQAGALENFQKALSMAEALGEEGATLATDCKNIIPKLFLQLGKEAANAKEMDKAIELLAQAEKLGNEYGLAEVAADAKDLVPQIYIMDGNNLLNEKKFAEAAAEYQKALDLNGENGMAWLRLGMCKASLNDAAGAAAAFTKAGEFGQKDAADKQLGNMYLKAAVAAYKAKNHTATLENVLKAAEFGNTKANIYGGMAAFNLKKYDECIKLLEGDGSVNAKYYLARAYEAKGNTAKACENYKAITSDKNFGAYATSKVGSLCK
jgi:tetratricopeptide (TPR) repeat protein